MSMTFTSNAVPQCSRTDPEEEPAIIFNRDDLHIRIMYQEIRMTVKIDRYRLHFPIKNNINIS